MNLWAAQFALPVYAWVPLGLAALVPLLLLALILPLSRRRGRGIATALTLRTMVVLAVGFGLLATVATVAVVQTGLRELRQRHTIDARALADGLEHGPLGLAAGDAQLRFTLFRAKESDIAFVVAGTDGCSSVCVLNFAEKRFNPRTLRAALVSAWPMSSTDRFTISVDSKPYLLVSSPVRDVAGKPRAAVVVGIDAQYLADQAARTTWLLLGISYSMLFVVGWTSWRQVSRSLTTRIRAINAQLQEGVVDDAPHEILEVDGHELRQLADSVSTYIKRSLDERSSSDERHRRLAELSPDAVLMCADRRIRSANPAAIALAGARNRSDLVASTIDKFLEYDNKAAAEGGSNALRPATWRRVDGGLLHVEVAEITDSTRGEVIRQFVVRDVTSRKRREADLAHRAEHDSLTNLVNRSRFESRLNELMDPAAGLSSKLGHDREVAVLFIDLDGFKPVNDTYGHAAGDAVLVAVAGRLRDSTRGSDLIARLGGDEFAVLLEVRDTAEVSAVSRRIIRALRQHIPHEGNLLTIGASIGIASTRPGNSGADQSESAMSAAELVKAADEAMYAAKSGGGDRIVLFGSIGQSTEQLSDVSFPKVA